jgi:hypothetical protein
LAIWEIGTIKYVLGNITYPLFAADSAIEAIDKRSILINIKSVTWFGYVITGYMSNIAEQ